MNFALSYFRPTRRQLEAEALAILQRHQARCGPTVLWAGLSESAPIFDARLAATRARLPREAPLLAVAAGRRTAASAARLRDFRVRGGTR